MTSMLLIIIALITMILFFSFYHAPLSLREPLILWNITNSVGFLLPFSMYFLLDQSDAFMPMTFRLNLDRHFSSATWLFFCGLLITNAVYCSLRLGLPFIAQRPASGLLHPREDLPFGPVFFLWLIVWLIGVTLQLSLLGSAIESLTALQTKSSTFTEGRVHLLLPSMFAGALKSVVVIAYIIQGRRGFSDRIMFWTAISLPLLWSFLVGGRMAALLQAVVPLAAVVILRRATIRWSVIVLVCLFALIVTAGGLALRSYAQTSRAGIAMMSSMAASPVVSLAYSFNLLESTSLAWDVYLNESVRRMGIIESYANASLPRFVFPDKGPPLQLSMREYLYGDRLGGITVGYYGEWIYYYGALGVVIGGAVAGFMLWWVASGIQRAAIWPNAMFLFVPVLFEVTVSMPRNGAHIVLPALIPLVLTLMSLRLLFGSSVGRSEPGGAGSAGTPSARSC
jgi:hypothetical protein